MLMTVLAARRFKAHHDVFPIRVFRASLNASGIDVHFCHDPDCTRAARSSVLFVTSYRSDLLFGSQEAMAGYFDRARARGARVVWFDSSDGADVAYRALFDHVDVYAKEQLWADRGVYRRSMYQAALFKDFYKENYGAADPGGSAKRPLADGEIAKLTVAWNLGLCDWQIHGAGRARRALGVVIPYPRYRLSPTRRALARRHIDLAYRAPARGVASVDCHREQGRARVKALLADQQLNGRYEGRLAYSDYRRELAQTRMVPSPFGWGEICYRDFECFEAGALLLKPDMSHLETWPDVYRAGETYMSHAWDYTDFEEVVRRALADLGKAQRIATAGQRVFLDSLDVARSGAVFAEHFRATIRG